MGRSESQPHIKMKQYKIVITPTAQKDIQTGKNWYETQQTQLGNEFIDAIESAIKKIQSNPRLFINLQRY